MTATDPLPPLGAARPRRGTPWQYLVGLLLVALVALVCWMLRPRTDHYFAGLVLLLAIVLTGTRWPRGPVLAQTVASALVWNFFFIEPRFTLTIDAPQDILMFIDFFIVALGMGHLTTQLRAREEAIERHHREREALLAEKHRADLLGESERLYRTLFDSVSHELKTPLAIIRTALESRQPDGDPYLAEIGTASRRLEHIVGRFLDMSRLESETLRPRPDWCEAGDVIDAAIAALGDDLAGHPLTIGGLDDLPLLRLDSALLSQALANVLHNAARHGPPGTPIEIHAGLPVPGTFEIRVRDHGPGLPPGDPERLFGKFQRGSDALPGGTGLGLAIARGLMRALRGDISAADHPAGGAEFRLHLPVETLQTPPPGDL